jgi:hypothetical protein
MEDIQKGKNTGRKLKRKDYGNTEETANLMLINLYETEAMLRRRLYGNVFNINK